jgi:HSF-type DNA-binding
MHIVMMGGRSHKNSRNLFVYGPPQGEEDELESIQIIIPPKPGEENTYCPENPQTLDVCSLTMASMGQETNLPSSKLPFTWKLFEMLGNVHEQGMSHVVSWVDGGRAFKVHDLKAFVNEIIPMYFMQSKYKSFQRQLYFYGFTRVTKGPDAGAYFHPKFIRGRKTLCLSITPKGKCRQAKNELKLKGDQQSHMETTPDLPCEVDAPPPAPKQAPRRVSADTIDEVAGLVDQHDDEDHHADGQNYDCEPQVESGWMTTMTNIIMNGTRGTVQQPARVSYVSCESDAAAPREPRHNEYEQPSQRHWEQFQRHQQAEQQRVHYQYMQRSLHEGDTCDIFDDMTFHFVDNSSL